MAQAAVRQIKSGNVCSVRSVVMKDAVHKKSIITVMFQYYSRRIMLHATLDNPLLCKIVFAIDRQVTYCCVLHFSFHLDNRREVRTGRGLHKRTQARFVFRPV